MVAQQQKPGKPFPLWQHGVAARPLKSISGSHHRWKPLVGSHTI